MQRLVLVLALLFPAAALSEPISGYQFMEPSTRQLQDDDFLNPAFFLVERGRQLWDGAWPGAPEGAASCQSCHGAPESSMRGVSARYPALDSATGKLVNLELKIQSEIARKLSAEPPQYESADLLALTALIAFQSRGMPLDVPTGEKVAGWLAQGEEIYTTRRGQLNLSCQNCHGEHWGQKLRGDTISQGHSNAFPIFRLIWDEVGSLHRMFSWCMEAVRAEPYAYGSEEYLALELYLADRGRGLTIESPGVRR